MDTIEFTPVTGNYEFEVRTPECPKYSYPKFIKDVFNNYAIGQLPPGYAENGNFGPKVPKNSWGDLCLEFPMAICILALAALMPLVGIACCILTRAKKSDKCETSCQRLCRWCSYLLLLIPICIMLLGLWVAFISNLTLLKTAAEANAYVEQFLQKMEEDINHVTIRNYMELGDYYVASMADLITEWLQYRDQEFRKLTFHKMDHISKGLSEISNKMHSIQTDVNKLECNFTLLLDYLRFYARNVSIYLGLHHTGHRVLQDTTMGSLNKKSIQFTDIDEISRAARQTYQIAEALAGRFGLATALHETISVSVNKSLLRYSAGVKNFLDNQANEFKGLGRNILHQIAEESSSAQAAGKAKSDNTIPRFVISSGLIACALLMGIVLLLIAGLFLAAFAKRSVAARVLNCSIIAALVLFSPIAVITCLHFLYGAVVNNGICASNRLARKDRASQSLLFTCSKNETIYPKMLLQGKVDKISHTGNLVKFDGVTKALIEDVIHTTVREFPQNYTSEAIKSLVKSATQSFPVNICKDLRAPLQLTYLGSVLDRVAVYCEAKSGGIEDYDLFMPYSAIRRQRCICLQNYYRTTILKNFVENGMVPRMSKIDRDCDVLRSYFPEGVQTSTEDYLGEIDKLFKFYKEDLKVDLNSLAVKLKYVYQRQFGQYMKWLKNTVQDDIGFCGGLAESQGEDFDSTCKCAMAPLNGYWSGMCLALFALLPIVILGMVLATLLQKPCVDYSNSNKKKKDSNIIQKMTALPPFPLVKSRALRNSESEIGYLSDDYAANADPFTQIYPLMKSAAGSRYECRTARPSRNAERTMDPVCSCDIDPNKLNVRARKIIDCESDYRRTVDPVCSCDKDAINKTHVRANKTVDGSSGNEKDPHIDPKKLSVRAKRLVDYESEYGETMDPVSSCDIEANKLNARANKLIDGESDYRKTMGPACSCDKDATNKTHVRANKTIDGNSGNEKDPHYKRKVRTKIIIDDGDCSEDRHSGQSDPSRATRAGVPQDANRAELGECNQGSRRKRIVIKYIHRKPSSEL